MRFHSSLKKVVSSWTLKVVLTLTLLLSIMSLNALTQGPTNEPFAKQAILNLVQKPPGFSDEAIADLIKEIKVNFEVTPAIEGELAANGVTPPVIEACRANYLAPRKTTPNPQPSPQPSIEGDGPLSREEVFDLLKKKVVATKIEKAVEDRGVSFVLDPTATAEIKRLGGTNALIGAIASRYVVVNTSPLTKDEVLDMLRKKVALTKIEGTVEKRGVSFSLDPTTTGEIKQAGGSNALLGAIASRYSAPTNANNASSTVNAATQAVSNYFRFVDQTIVALKARNFPAVMAEAQKAITINDKLPQAHYLLGYANLYLVGNVVDAARHFRNAIDRGGEVSFIVINDRKDVADKTFMAMEGANTQGVSGVIGKIPGIGRRPAPSPPSGATAAFADSCKGLLFISKNRVKFQADDNKNSFDVPISLIVETDLNKVYGKDKLAFHLKVKGNGDDKKNYNFTMSSGFSGSISAFTKDETNLAINLINTEKTRTTSR